MLKIQGKTQKMNLPAASRQWIKRKSVSVIFGIHVFSPQTPLPHVYLSANGWSINKAK
jgi:hypothetical protein